MRVSISLQHGPDCLALIMVREKVLVQLNAKCSMNKGRGRRWIAEAYPALLK
jgi:hypothetical protein